MQPFSISVELEGRRPATWIKVCEGPLTRRKHLHNLLLAPLSVRDLCRVWCVGSSISVNILSAIASISVVIKLSVKLSHQTVLRSFILGLHKKVGLDWITEIYGNLISVVLLSVQIQEVLYGSPLQRLELSIKAMHTNLGVAPVLNTCAVVEGRGQEELLTYLLKLKERSDELEQV